MATLVGLWPFAAQCYSWRQNIAFALGLSPEGVNWSTSIGPYTTALALITSPDWSTARQTDGN